MKKTRIEKILYTLPAELRRFTVGAELYDSSSSPEARVYYLKRGGDFFLKRGEAGTLYKEAVMTDFFHKKGLGAEVISYCPEEDCDWLLTARVIGEDCTDRHYLSEPKKLSALLGEQLRLLHELSYTGCPIADRMSDYVNTADANHKQGKFDPSLFDASVGFKDCAEAWEVFDTGRHLLKSDTLIHGDFCLPNIILDGWKLSGYIDLGGGGVGDRHVDLFWGAWTLNFNLGTDEFREIFFASYGNDRINRDTLRVIAAAEAFG